MPNELPGSHKINLNKVCIIFCFYLQLYVHNIWGENIKLCQFRDYHNEFEDELDVKAPEDSEFIHFRSYGK